ncbi:hypothetical protein KGF56_004514 [Candida oxycetoniae]|uniref:Uncharacterized protein n=1 Tax=Candida oxycetoniae TaxID=497107 RepID=A0AAI9WW68_9ASCO|nr:uncharacterized protein KGF56_004514 [Candida oxycetoniae]KAI3402633.2 hypothetical protein KGF56_004514 [Candida oxycetoniae]
MSRLEQIKSNVVYIWLKKILDFLLSQWFFCLLGVFVALAYEYPQFAKQGGMIRAEYSIGYGAVAVIFLISGLSMSTKSLVVNLLNWRAHFTVLSMSFLITSAIIYGIATGIRASHNKEIDEWLLVGMIVTHSCPTTVSSNVVMTKKAGGNDVLTLCEVTVGNILGAFVTPALLQMFMTGNWEFGNPSHQPTGDNSIQDLYGETMKQLGLSVFVPIFVGQVVQYMFPKQVKWTVSTFRLGKVGSFMLLLIMFQSFSTAFAQHAFTSVSHESIIFLVFFNIGIYLFFTAFAYVYSRPFFVKRLFSELPNENSSWVYRWSYWFFKPFYYDKKDTVAVMLCGPAKTAALGVSLISSQYGAHNPKLGILLVPLVLYQAEQVMTANFLVNFMKKWIEYDDNKENASDNENQLDLKNTKEENGEISQHETEIDREEDPKYISDDNALDREVNSSVSSPART